MTRGGARRYAFLHVHNLGGLDSDLLKRSRRPAVDPCRTSGQLILQIFFLDANLYRILQDENRDGLRRWSGKGSERKFCAFAGIHNLGSLRARGLSPFLPATVPVE